MNTVLIWEEFGWGKLWLEDVGGGKVMDFMVASKERRHRRSLVCRLSSASFCIIDLAFLFPCLWFHPLKVLLFERHFVFCSCTVR